MKLGAHNIAQLKAAVKKFGTVWFHGDGNIFDTEEKSKFRRDFSNPDAEDSKMWMKFTSLNQVPATGDELEKLIQTNTLKARKDKKEEDSKSTGRKIPSLKVEDDDAPAEVQGTARTSVPAGQKAADAPDTSQAKKDIDTHLENSLAMLKDQTEKAQSQLQEKAGALNSKESALNDKEAQLQAKQAELEARERELEKKKSDSAQTTF